MIFTEIHHKPSSTDSNQQHSWTRAVAQDAFSPHDIKADYGGVPIQQIPEGMSGLPEPNLKPAGPFKPISPELMDPGTFRVLPKIELTPDDDTMR